LKGIVLGNNADIFCGECGVVVRTVPAEELRDTLAEMERRLPNGSANCPHCGASNAGRGGGKLLAFVCQNCGRKVSFVPDLSSLPPLPLSDRVLKHEGGQAAQSEALEMAGTSPANDPREPRRWWSGPIIPIVSVVTAIIAVVITAINTNDNHKTTTIQVEKDRNDDLVKKINTAITANETINRIDHTTTGIDKRVSDLEQWKRDILDPNMRRVRIQQESLKRGQDEIRRKVESDEAFVKLSDPQRVIGLINGEIALATQSAIPLGAAKLVDYKAAMRGISPNASAYWSTVAAIINYQSLLDQRLGHAPDPAKVSRPCPFFTDSPSFANNSVGSGRPIVARGCIVDLDNTNDFLAPVTFINCVVRYGYKRPISFRQVRFVNCNFQLGAPPSNLPEDRFKLLQALLESSELTNVNFGM
jgi:hypothetical protein